ncbi:MAG: CSLREA domain-containing protein [Thermoanaerobaculia bacterium]
MTYTMRAGFLARLFAASALLALAPAGLGATSYSIATFADDSVVNGNCTLREAIRAANGNLAVDTCAAGGATDTITLPTGTYPFSGEEMLFGSGALTIQSQTLNPFDVSIDLSNVGRFLTLQGPGSEIVLGGLEVKSGLVPGVTASGGAILASDVSLTLFNFHFLSNVAEVSGGALFYEASQPGRKLLLRNGAFQSNSVPGSPSGPSGGGAAYITIDGGAQADIRDVAFISNSATSAAFSIQGGALVLSTSGANTAGSCVRCNFQSNSAVSTAPSGFNTVSGGAVYAAAYNGSRLQLIDGRYTGNSATGPAGATKSTTLSGGSSSLATLLLERLFIDFNAGSTDSATFDVGLENFGGGIGFYESQLTFGPASGLRVYSDSVVSLGHLTIADYPSTGGNFTVAGAGVVHLQNSILALNGANLVPGSNLLQTANFVGGDPLFLDEPNGDYHLDGLSPAINAGANGAFTIRLADLDHRSRFVDGLTDIGCYEFDGLFADNFEVGDAGSWSSHVP